MPFLFPTTQSSLPLPFRSICWGWLTLLVVALDAPAQQIDKSEFRAQYLVAVKQAQARLRSFQIECRTQRDGDSYAKQTTIYVLGDAGIAVTKFLTDDAEAAKTQGRLYGIVHANNPDYGFLLHQPKKGGPYVLKDLDQHSLADPGVRERINSYVDVVAFAPFCIGEDSFGEVLTHPAVEVAAVSPVAIGEGLTTDELVEVKFVRKPLASAPSPEVCAWSGTVRLNRSKGWRIESYRNVAYRPPGKFPGWFLSAELDYKEWPNGIEFPNSIRFSGTQDIRTAPIPQEVTEIQEVELNRVRDEVFRLPAYGISEPVFAQPGGRINKVVIWLVIGALCAFGLGAFLRRRGIAR